MNTTKDYRPENLKGDPLLETLRYDSLFSSKEFTIDSENNLRITEFSPINQRDELIPLDLIDPRSICKKSLDKSLLILGFMSAIFSVLFLSTAVLMNELWMSSFAVVFATFGVVTLISSHKHSKKLYQYKFINSEDILFSLNESSTQSHQVRKFIKALENKICKLDEKNEYSDTCEKIVNEENIQHLDIYHEEKNTRNEKQKQYLTHLDFLFNFGIVDEVLYQKLYKKINLKIEESENRFIEYIEYKDDIEDSTMPNNIIKFPVNG